MKILLTVIILTISGTHLFAQNDSLLKFIFIPHPRSADQVQQSVLAGIAHIDFPKFGVKMLGGDLTWSTSTNNATLLYCDSIFDLSNPNTLWSVGNHDLSGGRNLIKSYTGRESFYTYNRNGVTFIVLDTELEANSFTSTFIKGDQLQMVNNVCDSITESSALILLHHRFMWVANNNYFDPIRDSIAGSSRSLDTTNFYAEIYPLLQNVKNKGIPVHVFGGDRSDINITYSPEDSITFYAARLRDDLPENVNNVIVLNYNQQNREITTEFVPLADLVSSVAQSSSRLATKFILNQNYPNPFNPTTTITYQLQKSSKVELSIYNLLGQKVDKLVNKNQPTGIYNIQWDASGFASGLYYYRLETSSGFAQIKKLILLK